MQHGLHQYTFYIIVCVCVFIKFIMQIESILKTQFDAGFYSADGNNKNVQFF